jgi:DNA adenine methylase
VPELARWWQVGFNRYVEPFAGSASLFFAIGAKSALLADSNVELVNFYRWLKLDPQALYDLVTKLPSGEPAYYAIRAEHTSRAQTARDAARFYYLNRYCFNGLYRTNAAGHFNVPYAFLKTSKMPPNETFIAASKRLAEVEIRCCDFEATLGAVRAGDFVYLDPPYAVVGKRRTNQYGANTFDRTDLPRLAAALREIHSRGASFVLSYEASAEAKELAAPWEQHRVAVQRNIAGFACHRRESYELMVTNISRRLRRG